MSMSEKERMEKRPMREQIQHVESKTDVNDFRRHHIKQEEHQGSKVMGVSGIKEAMQAKAHLESQGARDIKIVGGTSKPYVVFR